MANPDSEHRWFAVQVKPRHEKTTAQALRLKGYEEFLPLQVARRRWSDRVKEVEVPLFPRYVFCRFYPQDRLRVLTTPGVELVVGVGGKPVPVDDSEVAALKAIAKSGLWVEPWPFLRVGKRVSIDAGPLCGLDGILVEFRNHQRLVVSVYLLERSVAVEVDQLWVSPVPDRRQQPPARQGQGVTDSGVHVRGCW